MFCVHFLTYAQTVEVSPEEFSKLMLNLEKQIPARTSYTYSGNYSFYNGDEILDTTLVLGFTLKYRAEDDLFNMSQFGRFIVQNQTCQIICDSAQHQLIIGDPIEEFTQRKTINDFELLSEKATKIEKEIKGGNTIYSIEFPSYSKFSSCELWIDKNNNVTKYVLYSAVEVAGNNEEMIKPRMEITYSGYQKGAKASVDKMFEPTHFMSDLKDLTPTIDYKNYEIIDLRN